MSEWKPILTIPSTGERVLVWDGARTILGRADDYWAFPRPHWLDDATHWMPLPPPPEAKP